MINTEPSMEDQLESITHNIPNTKNPQSFLMNNIKPIKHCLLLLLNCSIMASGVIANPLLARLYYLHGGHRKWLLTFSQSAGFPLLFIPLTILHFFSKTSETPSILFMEPKLFLLSSLAGLLIFLDNFLYIIGLSYLPVSTAVLLYSTQLAFVAVFARFIVKQKFTAFSVNAVVVMTLGSVILGLRANGDRPEGVSDGLYLLGFFLTLLSAALLGLIWPYVEWCYLKSKRSVDYGVVLQFQLSASVVATVASVVGMLINNDFQAIHREANEFGLGRKMYIVIVVAETMSGQLAYLGTLGVIYCASSLFSGIFQAVLVPLIEVGAVVAYKERFTGEKGMSLALCVWGFTSYFYGEYKKTKKKVKNDNGSHHEQEAVAAHDPPIV